MKSALITLYDIKSQTYTTPRAEASTGVAIRNFADAVNDSGEKTMLNQHPEDFTLFHIADFDIQTGNILLLDQKSAIANGVDVKV